MIPYLNDDVFYAIIESALSSNRSYPACQSTVAAMMLLSRACSFTGGKLLASSEIKIETLKQLSSFVMFCMADDGSRARHVKDLTIDIPKELRFEPIEPWARPLAELMLKLSNVSRLSLTPAYSLLSEGALQREIASLASLNDLSLSEDRSSLSMRFLAKIKTPLRHLTLRKIYTPSSSEDRTTTMSFPEVSGLNIVSETGKTVYIRPCYIAWSRLSSLAVEVVPLDSLNFTASDHQEDFEQRFFRRGANKMGNSRWGTLDELSGSVVDIWTLGLLCRTVRRLVLHVGQYHEYRRRLPRRWICWQTYSRTSARRRWS
ncbi:hypothetical protein OH76DRAFT_812913 [Lentinus brumalis]|uniref:Uncharacterized protein n=1 Tax=Lentinus brumalis TaxID=2498619 RepID=A0A371D2F1_9APHY|nr:hypothetical protein OH76DRAFT_812913 [Polyporus brumalis]